MLDAHTCLTILNSTFIFVNLFEHIIGMDHNGHDAFVLFYFYSIYFISF